MSDPEMIQNDEAVREILDRAAELPAERREAFLTDACAENESLRREVESLLAALDSADHLMATPTARPGPTNLGSVAEKPGDVIGRYKLLQQIGEGGFGVVFMAEQQHPVRRTVAIKVLKPGMDTRQVIARFEAERQALAMMDHPGIAKVLDAGSTESGRPYFVMELVRGSPLTEYCDKHKLSTRARLQLFIEVCQAVQHAHGKGIIHRDLKPSNVLVTVADDGHPVPKVIDFGIAKATFAEQRLTERTLFTEFRQLIGTPQYMSPEQAESDAMAAADTRSDVYALGVLLYELLTGSTPFEKDRLARAAYEEVRRILREEDPPHPSTRLSILAGETLTSVAEQRDTDPKRLGQLVRGELDWIVMRAMEKDRNRRYPTANGLARDIERFLADEPVEACPPSAMYRVRKFTHRHRAMMVTVTSFALVLMVATALSSWEAVRAMRAKAIAVAAESRASKERDEAQAQKRRADEQAAIAQAVNDFLVTMLQSPAPWRGLTEEVTVLRATRIAIARLDGGALDGQPLTEAAVRQTIGSTLSLLGHRDESEPVLRKALALRRAVLQPGHPDIAQSLVELAGALTGPQATDEAEKMLREALVIHRRNLPQRELEYSYNLTGLAGVLRLRRSSESRADRERFDEAKQLDSEALAIRRRLFPDGNAHVAHALIRLSYDLVNEAKPAEAESALREAVAINRKIASPDLPITLRVLADHLRRIGKLEEAKALMDENAAITGGDDSLGRADLLRTEARMLEQKGKLSEAEPLYREALVIRLKDLPPADWHAGEALVDLAALLKAEGKAERVIELYEQYGKPFYGEALKKRKAEGETREVVFAFVDVGHVLASAGRLAEAEAIYRDVLQMRRKLYPEQHEQVKASLTRLTKLLRDEGRTADADALWRQTVEIRQKVMAEKAPEFQARAYLIVIPAMLSCGQVEQAKAFCATALEMKAVNPNLLNTAAWYFATHPPPVRDAQLAVKLATRSLEVAPTDADARNTLGVALYRVGKFKEAIAELERSEQLRDKVEPSDLLFLAMAHARLGNRQAAHDWYAKLDMANLKLTQNEELRGFLKEAEEVIAVGDKPTTRP